MGTEESDQLPEEGSDQYTPDDDGPDSKPENAGGADKGDEDSDKATGNPGNAG
jgi:hypothetical protein